MNTLYAGIDLHSNNHVLVVIDASNTVVLERRLRNDLAALLTALAPFGREVGGVVVESTFRRGPGALRAITTPVVRGSVADCVRVGISRAFP